MTASTRLPAATLPGPKDWTNIAFLTLTPLVGIAGTAAWTWHVGFAPWMAVLLGTMYLLVGLSICAGYHRFFSHKSYECSPAVQVFYAVFGAMAAQNSIAGWSSGHRLHHQHVDEDWDPYNIQRGFWWAHIVWVFHRRDSASYRDNVPDLMRNPVVRWQDRWYKPLLLAGGFGLPALVGAWCGDVVAGLLWGGFARIVLIHHTTFFVNSLAHSLGSRRYDAEVSACDNWMVALVTLGEGYHSFHHKFPADYRNGIRWYHWDPAKWLIRGLQLVGLASRLNHTAAPRIEEAQMRAAIRQVEDRLAAAPKELGEEIGGRIQAARDALEHARELWRRQAEERAGGLARACRTTRREARTLLRAARREWRQALRLLVQVPATA
jgi:stearoyl-CoA desaturase (delta-9 desaturase)